MKTQIEIVGEDVQFIRTFAAPRETVFEAWTDPEKVQMWWGCAQTTSVQSAVDLQVGGEYTHVMQIEGAGRHVMKGVFTEVDPPRRLAYSIQAKPTAGMPTPPPAEITIDFRDRGGETEVCLTVIGLNASEYKDIIRQGWKAAFDKLSRLLHGTFQAAG